MKRSLDAAYRLRSPAFEADERLGVAKRAAGSKVRVHRFVRRRERYMTKAIRLLRKERQPKHRSEASS